MADINKVVLVGRLTRDCEMKSLSNTSLCTFSIAVNRRTNQGGNWVDEPNFFDIELFGNLGPAIQPYLKKGQQIAVEGSLRQSRWEAQDGQKRSRVTINANNVQLLGGNRNDGGGPQSYQQQGNQGYQQAGGYSGENMGAPQSADYNNSQNASQSAPPRAGGNDFQDDIPF